MLPNQAGTAGTWNFQLHPAFWLGMALCDNQSAPEFTHDPCTPDSDTNIFDGTNPAGPDYIGKHPGTAFLEVQFYPPGWAPWPPGVSCDPTQWCSAMAIFSLLQDQNTGTLNNANCRARAGDEPANFAFITTSGVPHAPPAPLTQTAGTFTPSAATDLFMGSGDQLTVDIHDGAAGLVVTIHDLTTGGTGSMTASAANGFAQVNFQPTAATCSQSPYTFRPMYATSSEHTRVPWAAHSYNVAFSDEIGHFEYCSAVTGEGGDCTSNNEDVLDDDDTGCFSAAFSLFVPIGGCIASDDDFDGTSYQPVWPGTDPNRGQDKKYHPSPIAFTSPLFNGSQNYSRVAFETDLPRIEAPDSGGICNRFTGENCVNPPPGSNFYPIYTTGTLDGQPERQRPLHLAVRRAVPQGDDQHVRRELGGRVRTAAVQLLPQPQPRDSAQDEQLPSDPELESLPGLVETGEADKESAPTGRSPLTWGVGLPRSARSTNWSCTACAGCSRLRSRCRRP